MSLRDKARMVVELSKFPIDLPAKKAAMAALESALDDEEEAITREWLESIGFKPVASDLRPSIGDHYEREINIFEFKDTGEWLFNDADSIGLNTRGDLYDLLRLLGKETK